MPRLSSKRQHMIETLTRAQIREAVAGIITTCGVQGLTMDKIAAEAGLAKGTLYRYYESKECLLGDTVKFCFSCMVDEIRVLLDSEGSARSRIEAMLRFHLEYFDRHRDFFRVLLYERNMSQSGVRRFGSSIYRRLLDGVAAVISRGIEQGDFRPVNPLRAAALLMESSIAVIGQRLVSPEPADLEEDVALLTGFIFHGICRETNNGDRDR